MTWLKAAEIADKHDFLRSLAADWLTAWPDDREVLLILARMELEEGRTAAAVERLRRTIELDPEEAEAYALLGKALRAARDAAAVVYEALARVVRGDTAADYPNAPPWVASVEAALKSLAERQGDSALQQLGPVLAADLDTPLPTWLAVKAHHIRGAEEAAHALARSALARWPSSVPFRLFVGRYQLDSGESAQGIASLKRAAAHDPVGQLAKRILGEEHPFEGLWPRTLEAAVDRPLPAEIAAILGINRFSPVDLGAKQIGHAVAGSRPARQSGPAEVAGDDFQTPQAQPQDQAAEDWPRPEPWEAFRGPDPGTGLEDRAEEGKSERVRQIEQELEQLSLRLAKDINRTDLDGRVPAYIAVSSKTRLIQAFGEDRFHRIDEAVLSLIEAVRRRPGWNAYRLYIDDPENIESFGLQPADPGNAWQIKHRISDLDQSLADRGEMVGALLIIGGHEVIPFHMLPNPTDDIDEAVPSDNPYSATDENYFAPEWAVGRLPFDDDCDQIVQLLRSARAQHEDARRPVSPLIRFKLWLQRRISRVIRGQAGSVGYSANIWRRASMHVFRTIGEPRALMTSPPVNASRLHRVGVPPALLSYFNLHGLEDAPEWFGQRDPLHDVDATEEFPVALRPTDVVNSGRAPRVVFTEACYGAHVVGKTIDTALALKFLSAGSQAVVGSTKISYGSISPPLLAADLLGKFFWDHLKHNHPVGEALRRAKLGLAAEMHRRQGYLDGEDQKALISFVLYGDPLYSPESIVPVPRRKAIHRRMTRPKSMQTACALGTVQGTAQALDASERERVESIVSRYLPGMKDAACSIHPQHAGCNGEDHICPSIQMGIKSNPSAQAQTMVVTLSKNLEEGQHHHPHFARLTLDPEGRVLKLTVSR